MAKKIVWSKRAIKSFNSVINYLETEWNDAVTENFVIHTYNAIELLADNHEIGTIEDPGRNIRGFLVTKHNILFYRTTDKKIILLNLHDTRSNPKKSKY